MGKLSIFSNKLIFVDFIFEQKNKKFNSMNINHYTVLALSLLTIFSVNSFISTNLTIGTSETAGDLLSTPTSTTASTTAF